MSARLVLAAGGLLAALAVAGCHTATGPAGLPTARCDNAARVATSDPNRSARRIDPVLLACTSIPDLEAVGSTYGIALVGPDIIGVARTRCRMPTAPRDGSLCPAILALPADPGPSGAQMSD
jgi:hypothetical protein